MVELEQEYERIKKNYETEQQWYEIRQSTIGGGVTDYNFDTDILEMQMKMLLEQEEYVERHYKELQDIYTENSDEWKLLEAERLAAIEALQNEYADREVELEQEKAKKKLDIQKAYISAYQSLSSQLSGMLGAMMANYDENSKAYLNMRYAQGVTDTLSGTLSAYMSGIESGLPAPANAVLASIMAAMTFATGVAQLRNIKSGSLSNATAKTVNIGNEYDTLTYKNSVDTLSAIKDQRVWVLESDISNAQKRVRVQENNATF